LDLQAIAASPLIIRCLPPVPALPSTVVHIEFLLAERGIDLEALSQIVASDLGAMIEVLRMVGDLYDDEESRPYRVQDCVVVLGAELLSRCIAGMDNTSYRAQGPSIVKFWERARRIGLFARALASPFPAFDREKAYLAGLLHELGRLPKLLGWDLPVLSTDDISRAGSLLAEAWSLPSFVTSAIRDRSTSGLSSFWSHTVAASQELVDLSENLTGCGLESSLPSRFEQQLMPRFPKMRSSERDELLPSLLALSMSAE
jgi:HD-like signal output (HDOD) protein